MADGLDSLAAMRTKSATSRRTMPPPRHQPRSTPVEMPVTTPPPAQAETLPVLEHPIRTPPQSSTDLTKVSIYLDDTTDGYLETVRTAARTAKPRVDATRSAVVRLALNRLADQLGPTEVVAELQRNAAAQTGPGRKRS